MAVVAVEVKVEDSALPCSGSVCGATSLVPDASAVGTSRMMALRVLLGDDVVESAAAAAAAGAAADVVVVVVVSVVLVVLGACFGSWRCCFCFSCRCSLMEFDNMLWGALGLCWGGVCFANENLEKSFSFEMPFGPGESGVDVDVEAAAAGAWLPFLGRLLFTDVETVMGLQVTDACFFCSATLARSR